MKLKNLNDIRAVFMDVDGVLTDGMIALGNAGEMKSFNVRDGMAITIALRCGLKIGFITSRTSESVKKRADELKIHILVQGSHNKLSDIRKISTSENIPLREICYIGDDIVDIPALKTVGFSATVSDAPDEVRECVTYIAKKPGGHEAVRDIIRHILIAQGKWSAAIDAMVSELENVP